MSLEVDNGILHIHSARPTVTSQSPYTVNYEFDAPKITWKVTYHTTPQSVTIESEITNHSNAPLTLGKAHLLQSSPVDFTQVQDDVVVLPWRVWGQLDVYSLTDPQLPNLAKVKAQFYNRTQHKALQTAFLTFQRCNTEIQFDFSNAQLNSMDAYCDFAGWQLAPSETTTTETFRIMLSDDPYAQLENWADSVASTITRPIWPGTPIGYLGWSWTCCVDGKQNYQDLVLEMLDSINEKLADLGISYLWTSMSNFKGSLPGNWLKWNEYNIPMGREKFIAEVNKRGFMQGFWIGPFYLCSMLEEMFEQFRDAILQKPDGGDMIVSEEWRHGDAGLIPKKQRPCLYALDPSHPKVIEFIKKVFSTYREWGIRYYMIDFLEAGAGNIHRFPYKTHHNKNMIAGPEVYTNFLRTMKDAAGEDAYLLSATGPSLHHAGILDGIRTGNDFGEGRRISPDSFFYPASYVINDLSYWTGPRYALTNQAATYHTHRKLYVNDSGNVLTVDQPIPTPHAQLHATIHGLSGGPTMLGDDMRHIHPQRLELIRKTLPRATKTFKPIDLFESPRPQGPRIFHRHIIAPCGSYDVIAVYNLTKKPITIQRSLADFGLDPASSYLTWDFWNEMFLGPFTNSLTIRVNPESVTVLRLAKNPGHPTLLGTDMHLLMGEMEITKFTWNAETMICSFTATRPENHHGSVFIHAPSNVFIKNIDGLHIAKDGRDNSLIISVPIHFDSTKQFSRQITFAPLQDNLRQQSELDLH